MNTEKRKKNRKWLGKGNWIVINMDIFSFTNEKISICKNLAL